MGPLIKYTDRLILKVENEDKARAVLNLYLRNRYAFEQYEPTRPKNFYSIEYHKKCLAREFKFYNLGYFLRYYIYLKDNPCKILGSINFNFTNDGTNHTAEIGYKLDTMYQKQGIAYEACKAAIEVIKENYEINQIDARILPANESSIKLATKLGLVPIAYEPQSANILGRFVDLVRYSMTI